MKPLELTTYPRDEHGDYIEDRFVHAVELVDVYGYAKRLTDAELAAEYWSQQFDVALLAIGSRDDLLPRERDRMQTLHRFATVPHYDEGQS